MKTIFLEGKSDEKFIREVLFYCGYRPDQFKINILNGSDIVLLSRRLTELQASSDKGWSNKVILDANGSSDLKRREFAKFIDEYNTKAELYLFPDDKSPGILEDLLENIIPVDKVNIIPCFESYKQCLISLGYKGPFPKSKIYAYLEATCSALSKPEIANVMNLDFSNPIFWNLDSEVLINLKSFLNQ